MRSGSFTCKPFVIILFLALFSPVVRGQEVPIIPKPSVSKPMNERFVLTRATPIVIESQEAAKTGYFLQQELLKHTGIAVTIQDVATSPAIVLRLSTEKGENAEAYRLTMRARQIQVTSSDTDGLFLG